MSTNKQFGNGWMDVGYVVQPVNGAAKRHQRAGLLNDVSCMEAAGVAANKLSVADYQLQQPAVGFIGHGASVGAVRRLGVTVGAVLPTCSAVC